MSVWVDPFYTKMVDKYKSEVQAQQEIVNRLVNELKEFDLANPQAKSKASTSIGGISHYFTGAVKRRGMAFQLKEARAKLAQLKTELKKWKEIQQRKG